jgi:tape measure domain-containing protein
MTTITALNVRLGMDVSNFSEGANLAKGEVTKVASIMRQSVPASEKFKQELDLLNRAFSESGKQSVQYANAVEMLNKKHQQGKYSAEEVAKAEAESARVTAQAASAKKRLKFEIDELAKAERQHLAVLEKGKQLTQSVERAQETHNRKMREYRELLRAGAIDQETFRRAVDKSNKALKESQTSTGSAIQSIKGMAAAYLSVQTVAKAINLASQVEDATIAFEVLTGSAKDGQLLFEQIRKFAAESPVTFSNAAEATKTMMSFGVAAQDVQKNLQMLSDVTGGNNERFKMLSLAFSQTTAAGRLMGQDLLQIINSGFNPLQQISKTTGETMIELKKRMEDGGISAQEVRQAFIDATSEGGMFEGMTDRLAQTVSGKLNIALSDMEQRLAAAGEALGPLIIQLLDASEDLKPLMEDAIKLLGLFAQGAGFVLAITQDIERLKKGDFGFEKTNAFLDRLEERERKLEADKAAAVNAEFQQKQAAVNHVAIAERKAAEERAKLHAKFVEDQKKAAEDAEKQRKKNIEKQKADAEKAVKQAQELRAKVAREREEQFQRDMETARKAAMDYFAEQEEKQKQRREDVTAGPGAGMEVGSAEAAKFSADQINRQIGVAAVPDQPTPGEVQIAWKAEQLFREQQATNAAAQRQIAIMESLLSEARENGFRRIR